MADLAGDVLLGRRFLSFEGTEGSGKTTQVRRLEAELAQAGWNTLLVREPGGTALSERVRTLLLDPATGVVAPWAELALYVAARAQLVAESIRPALEAGRLVLADRFGDSSVVYQGVARGIPVEQIEQLNDWATGTLRPGLTVLFDLDPEVGLARISSRGTRDRLESEPLEFHHKVRNGYLALAARSPERVQVLDASLPEEEVFARLRSLVFTHLAGVDSGEISRA
ncbi:MAG: dTMP kinase [Candidatus Eisenbacteria bacterium]